MGNYQKVLEDSNKAIELDPTNALGYINRSFAYIKLGHYQHALEDTTRALDLDPRNSLCYANRGDAHYNLGNYAKAINDYKTGARMGHEGCQRVLRSKGIGW
jgi:tetratricopeptide (TPR) repeat protein